MLFVFINGLRFRYIFITFYLYKNLDVLIWHKKNEIVLKEKIGIFTLD